jgi:hypothetical protein
MPTVDRLTEDEEFLRKLTFCEEERLTLTAAKWAGEFRWFRSPNIVPLERYRELEQMSRILTILRQRVRDHEVRAIQDLISESHEAEGL